MSTSLSVAVLFRQLVPPKPVLGGEEPLCSTQPKLHPPSHGHGFCHPQLQLLFWHPNISSSRAWLQLLKGLLYVVDQSILSVGPALEDLLARGYNNLALCHGPVSAAGTFTPGRPTLPFTGTFVRVVRSRLSTKGISLVTEAVLSLSSGEL